MNVRELTVSTIFSHNKKKGMYELLAYAIVMLLCYLTAIIEPPQLLKPG